MRMPFGRYKGVELADLPLDYLEWLKALDDLREPLRTAVEREWRLRFEHTSGAGGPKISREAVVMAEEIVSAGYRALARIHHPDVGGEHRAMVLLNEAAAWLRGQTRAT